MRPQPSWSRLLSTGCCNCNNERINKHENCGNCGAHCCGSSASKYVALDSLCRPSCRSQDRVDCNGKNDIPEREIASTDYKEWRYAAVTKNIRKDSQSD